MHTTLMGPIVGARVRALEGAAWVGLFASLLAVALAAGMPAGRLEYAMGPADLTAWVTAICSAVGALTAALNGLAIAIHRWGRAPRRPHKRHDGPPPAAG